MRSVVVLVISAAFLAVGWLAGCEREGPMEKAGRNVDQAGKDIRDAVKGKK